MPRVPTRRRSVPVRPRREEDGPRCSEEQQDGRAPWRPWHPCLPQTRPRWAREGRDSAGQNYQPFGSTSLADVNLWDIYFSARGINIHVLPVELVECVGYT